MVDRPVLATDPDVAVVVEEQPGPAISWPAIWAGAVAATAMSLILLLLGTGWGLASISPWAGAGASAAAFGVGAAIWLIVVQWLSSALGGYLAGRLRTRWNGVHSDEVFFRDTAQGLVTWALATLIVVAFVALSTWSAIRTGAEAAATVAASATEQGVAANHDETIAYLNDTLLRTPGSPADGETRDETLRVLAHGFLAGEIAAEDRAYLVDVVVAATGLTTAEAEERVATVVGEVETAAEELRTAADEAREAASMLAFYTFFSMLIGAFIASVAGVVGGRQRDV